jgi:hypothetical protein
VSFLNGQVGAATVVRGASVGLSENEMEKDQNKIFFRAFCRLLSRIIVEKKRLFCFKT